jgi:hypothetical protein
VIFLPKAKKGKGIKWERVPQPADLVAEVSDIVKERPELGYTGVPEFYRAAVREKIERVRAVKESPVEVPAQ